MGSQFQKTRRFVYIFLFLVVAACSKSPEQARKDLVEMGLPFDESTFYAVAQRCDALPIKNFVAGGMNSAIGLVGAASGGCLEIVKQLVKDVKDPSVLAEGLHTAVDADPSPERLEILKVLLNRGADPNARFANADFHLDEAAKRNNFEALKLLLDKGANPNDSDGNSNALIYAVKNNKEATELLLDKGANPSSALLTAVNAENTEMVKLLLAKGADPNGSGETGSESLRRAIGKRQVEMVKILLDAGAEVNDGQNGESDSLRHAFTPSRDISPEIIKLLLAKGANPNSVVGYKQSAIYAAVEVKNIELLKLLFQHGAKANDGTEKMQGGSIALQKAVESNNVQAVQVLLDNGANPNTKGFSYTDCNVLSIARKREYAEVETLLQSKGGTIGSGQYCDRR